MSENQEPAYEEMTSEEILEKIRSEEITLDDIREDEGLRRRIQRLVLKADMAEYRDVYERLAEV